MACLRIIACGGGSIIAANEAAFVDQTKGPKEKRGWSFKKKSSTNRAVMNPPIPETPSFEHKENIHSAVRDFFVSEKDSGSQWDEKSPAPPHVAVDLHIPDGAIVYETEKQLTASAANLYIADDVSSPQSDKEPVTAAAKSYVAHEVPSPKTEKHSGAANLCVKDGMTVFKTGEYEPTLAGHESDVIVIQLESLIKLQAMVRGHLVRCHAVGALRCLQAIAKMQVLVRARYACTRKDCIPPKSKPAITYTSMKHLLKNSFARQLLESSPKSKPIKIKCDPLSRDSSWVWLERWMSLASPGAVDDLNARNEMAQDVKITDKDRKEKTIAKEQEANITVEDYLFDEEKDIFLNVKDGSLSLSRESSKLEVTEDEKLTNRDALPVKLSDVDSHSASFVEGQKPDILDEVETVEWALDYVSGSQEETGKWLATESEPANLSESVLQNARAEEPISGAHLAVVYHDSVPLKAKMVKAPGSVTYSDTDYIHESQSWKTENAALPHSSEFDLIEETDASSEDDIVINLEVEHSSIQVGESNCTVELSELFISSTLGSPDRSEIEPVKVELEKLVPVNVPSHESKLDTVANELETELGSAEKGNSDLVNCESAVYGTTDDTGINEKELVTNVSIAEFQSEEKDRKTNVSDLHAETESAAEISHQESPGSQVTLSDSQVTTSSQVLVSKKSKIVKKSGSIKKRTILSATKRSSMNNASSEKNSSDRQPKKHNYVKRRTSFGSPKPEVPDQELQKDSTTSSSLPSYMQATKSARANANAPAIDIPDNEAQMKRHSSPSAKDKQGSPSHSRNSSHTHSGSKSSGTSPLERKWQR